MRFRHIEIGEYFMHNNLMHIKSDDRSGWVVQHGVVARFRPRDEVRSVEVGPPPEPSRRVEPEGDYAFIETGFTFQSDGYWVESLERPGEFERASGRKAGDQTTLYRRVKKESAVGRWRTAEAWDDFGKIVRVRNTEAEGWVYDGGMVLRGYFPHRDRPFKVGYPGFGSFFWRYAEVAE